MTRAAARLLAVIRALCYLFTRRTYISLPPESYTSRWTEYYQNKIDEGKGKQ